MRCCQIEQFDTPANILTTPANDYVRSFIGHGAALKRLALIRVTDAELGPVVGTTASVAIAADATLRDALDTLVLTGLPSIDVHDAGGRAVGSLSVERISQVLGAEIPGATRVDAP